MKKYKLWGYADIKYTWEITDEVIEANSSDEAIAILLSRLTLQSVLIDDECPRLNFEEIKEGE